MAGQQNHVPGNTLQEAASIDKQMTVYGYGLTLFEHICSTSWRGEVEVTGFSVRPPQVIGGEWLVVVRGFDGEGGPVVGFHSALGVGEAVAGAAGRIKSGNMKWKVDEYRR